MAISTVNGKLALMEMEVWEPAIPIVDTNVIGQDDFQSFLWGFPEILWEEVGGTAGSAILDMNTRLDDYLTRFYSRTPPDDLQTLVVRYLMDLSGDYNNRWLQLIDDATI